MFTIFGMVNWAVSFIYKTPVATITRIYRHIQNGAQVTTRIPAIKPGAVCFAVPVHCPHGILKRMLWNLWGDIRDLYATTVSAVHPVAGERQPSNTARHQDRGTRRAAIERKYHRTGGDRSG
jgi:hypothetical protein